MARLSQEELAARLAEARTILEVGARYTHYKDPSKQYLLKSLAIIEATEEVGVTYQAQYGARISFIRPLSNFIETVSVEGIEVSRFQKV